MRACLARAAARGCGPGALSWHCNLAEVAAAAGADSVSEGTEMYSDSNGESYSYYTSSSVSTGDGLAKRWCERQALEVPDYEPLVC